MFSLEKAMATHSSTLAWKIPLMVEPGGLQSMGSLGIRPTERLRFHFSLSCIGEGNGNPLQCSCLENPRDRGAWWAAVYGVAQSRTRLKRLSSSSSMFSFLLYIPRSGIAGSYCIRLTLNKREHLTVFQSSCTIFHYSSNFSTSPPPLNTRLFDCRHPDRCEVLSHCDLHILSG